MNQQFIPPSRQPQMSSLPTANPQPAPPGSQTSLLFQVNLREDRYILSPQQMQLQIIVPVLRSLPSSHQDRPAHTAMKTSHNREIHLLSLFNIVIFQIVGEGRLHLLSSLRQYREHVTSVTNRTIARMYVDMGCT